MEAATGLCVPADAPVNLDRSLAVRALACVPFALNRIAQEVVLLASHRGSSSLHLDANLTRWAMCPCLSGFE